MIESMTEYYCPYCKKVIKGEAVIVHYVQWHPTALDKYPDRLVNEMIRRHYLGPPKAGIIERFLFTAVEVIDNLVDRIG